MHALALLRTGRPGACLTALLLLSADPCDIRNIIIFIFLPLRPLTHAVVSNRRLLARALQRAFPASFVAEAADGAEAVAYVARYLDQPPAVPLSSTAPEQPSSLERATYTLQTMPSSQSCSPASVPLSHRAALSSSPTVLRGRPAGGSMSPATPGATQPVDVVVMDHEMPVMTGSVATSRLRQLGVTCAIIGATGNALSKDKDAFKACGLNEIFTKPVNVCALTAWIRAYLATFPVASALACGASAGAGSGPCGSPRAVCSEQPEALLRPMAEARASAAAQPAGMLVNEAASASGKATLTQPLQALPQS